MCNLVVDIGNSSTKVAVFENDKIIFTHKVISFDSSVMNDILRQYPNITKAIVSSTRGEVSEIVAALSSRVKYCLDFNSTTRVPICNEYLTPQSLGRDRLAAAVGATIEYSGCDVLIVDFGTAITIDLITCDGRFKGGTISPGVTTRFRALQHFTASLPLCEATEESKLYGLTTIEAIQQGVMNGISFEIEGYIWRMREKYDKICIIFTGGDAKHFVKRIKNTIFANRNLLFCGLNRILEYNANEEYL